MRAARWVVSWVLALFVGGMFALLADAKLFIDPPFQNVVFVTIAERSGHALFEPTGRLVVGAIEALTVLLVVFPWTRRVGAVLAALVCAGAVAMHLSPWLGRETSLAIGGEETDRGALFMLSLALLAASLLLSVVHPGRASRA